jgi:large subunit ribosomal protein L25
MEITAEKREKLGRQTKVLRAEDFIPGAIFGKGMETIPITLNLLDFEKVLEAAGETELVDVKVKGNKDHKVLVKEVQYDPITDKIIHVGLYQPDLTEEINADIPVEIVGEEENPLVKSEEGMVLVLMDEIPVKSLPTDLPRNFKVDVSGIEEIGDGVVVGQLEYDKEKVEIVDLEDDALIVKIDYAEMEEEPEEEITEEEALAELEVTEEVAEGEEVPEGKEVVEEGKDEKDSGTAESEGISENKEA